MGLTAWIFRYWRHHLNGEELAIILLHFFQILLEVKLVLMLQLYLRRKIGYEGSSSSHPTLRIFSISYYLLTTILLTEISPDESFTEIK